MSEFDAQYAAVSRETVLELPPEAGIVICGYREWGRLRPYAVDRRNGGQYLRVALADDTLDVGFAIGEFGTPFGVPGLYGTPMQAGRIRPGNAVNLSLEYYKAAAEGGREKPFRDVQVMPGEVSIGYGVHPDHRGDEDRLGEEPTFYVRGRHTGFSHVDDVHGELLPGEPVAGEPGMKNFSMARIRFLLGDPVQDHLFREEMGVAWIQGAYE